MKLTIPVLLFAVLGVGCEWIPDLSQGPAKVVIDDSLSENQVAMVKQACAEWNTATDFQVFQIVYNDKRIQRHRIHIDDGPPNKGMQATADKTIWSCRVNLGKEEEKPTNRNLVIHELGHCLGLEHEHADANNKQDIMHHKLKKGAFITQAHIDYVREMGGKRAE